VKYAAERCPASAIDAKLSGAAKALGGASETAAVEWAKIAMPNSINSAMSTGNRNSDVMFDWLSLLTMAVVRSDRVQDR
jgi:hypothetical protein